MQKHRMITCQRDKSLRRLEQKEGLSFFSGLGGGALVWLESFLEGLSLRCVDVITF